MRRDALSKEILKLLQKNGGDRDATLAQVRARVYHLSAYSKPGRSIDHEYLKSRLSYDPVTGLFTWIRARADRIGKPIYGNKSSKYVYIVLDGRSYLAHILAVFYMTGKWPDQFIDHRNGIGKDNRWENLREATQSQNMANARFAIKKKSALPRGVFDRGPSRRLRYKVQIKMDGTTIDLGSFADIPAANAAYEAAAIKHFGDFAFAAREKQ